MQPISVSLEGSRSWGIGSAFCAMVLAIITLVLAASF